MTKPMQNNLQFTSSQTVDQDAIQTLFIQTFSDSESPEEGAMIGKLVNDLMHTTEPQDLFGFVALENEQVIGAIFFSRLWFDASDKVFLLSPVAVHTQHQGKTIGQQLIRYGLQQLIRYGLQQLKTEGAQTIFTYGDPAFYGKVGFAQTAQTIAKAPFPLSQLEGWLGLSLDAGEIEGALGNSRCVTAFNNAAYW